MRETMKLSQLDRRLGRIRRIYFGVYTAAGLIMLCAAGAMGQPVQPEKEQAVQEPKLRMIETNGIRISVRLTHQDLADMAGLTKETTSHILSRFKKDQLIAGHGKQLLILNLPRLQEMAPHAIP